jgi:Kinetochore Sim4 complex subunit FTA2
MVQQFRFFDPEDTREKMGWHENDQLTDEEVEGHTDPFYAECRAYGQIASRSRKRPIAVACHGFLSVSAKMETMFAKRFGVVDWDRPEKEIDLKPGQRQPFRALVKDLVVTEPEVTEKLVKSMLRELKALRSLGIYVMDVRWPNYKGGHLVDFSMAFTTPFCLFRKGVRQDWEIVQWKYQDLYDFDDMVRDELGMKTSIRAAPNEEVLGRLRRRV